jgi:putative ABC transport system substrate-binding protein
MPALGGTGRVTPKETFGFWSHCGHKPVRNPAAQQSPPPLLAQRSIHDVQAAASALGRQGEVLYASTNREIDTAFPSLVRKQAGALLVGPDPLFNNRLIQLATLAVYHRVPAIYFIARSLKAEDY